MARATASDITLIRTYSVSDSCFGALYFYFDRVCSTFVKAIKGATKTESLWRSFGIFRSEELEREASEPKAKPAPKCSYRKTRGEWVVCGPVEAVKAGHSVTVTKRDGSTKTETVGRTGRPFRKDGVEMVYGYLTQRQQPQMKQGNCDCCGSWDTLTRGRWGWHCSDCQGE